MKQTNAAIGITIILCVIGFASMHDAHPLAPNSGPRAATSASVWADVDAGSLVVLERSTSDRPVEECVTSRLSDPLWLGGWMHVERLDSQRAPTPQQVAFAECFSVIHGTN